MNQVLVAVFAALLLLSSEFAIGAKTKKTKHPSTLPTSSPTTRAPTAKFTPPHVVILLASEWGWNNVGYHGNSEMLTPFIDSLATENLILERFYTFTNSGPTRHSILTGRVPAHVSTDVGQQGSDQRRFNASDPISGYQGISLGMSTLSDKLKQLGYRGVFTGRWEAGFATPAHLPINRGFERFLGAFDDTIDYYDQSYKGNTMRDIVIKSTFFDSDHPPVPIKQNFNVYIQGDTIQDPATQNSQDVCMHTVKLGWIDDQPAYRYSQTGYLEDSWTTFTLERIYEHNVSRPMFLFHSFNVPHIPYEIPIAWQQPFVNVTNPNRRKLNAMIWYMDNAVAQIVTALKVKKMYDNTLIIMTSDNGGNLKYRAGGNNWPLRGGKTSFFDGALRVNTFMAGGVIPPSMRGKRLNEYVHAADIYKTVLDFAGAPPSFWEDEKAAKFNLPPIEGYSMKNLILGNVAKSPRTEIFIGPQTLISGDYKLITGTQVHSMPTEPVWPKPDSLQPDPIPGINANATYNSTFGVVNCGSGCLFNIKTDPGEMNDLAGSMPDLKQQMIQRLADLNTTIWFVYRGLPSPLACTVAVTKWGGFYGPFLPSPQL